MSKTTFRKLSFLLLLSSLFGCSSTSSVSEEVRDRINVKIASQEELQQKQAIDLVWEHFGHPYSDTNGVVNFIGSRSKVNPTTRRIARILHKLAISSPSNIEAWWREDELHRIQVFTPHGPPNPYAVELDALLSVFPELYQEFSEQDILIIGLEKNSHLNEH